MEILFRLLFYSDFSAELKQTEDKLQMNLK
jgi:hypothetical protein